MSQRKTTHPPAVLKCSACNGTGTKDDPPRLASEPCTTCLGKGTVRVVPKSKTNEPAVVVASTLDRRFLLLSTGAILLAVTQKSIDSDSYVRLRTSKFRTEKLRAAIFEPWPNSKHAAKALKRIESGLALHKAKDAQSSKTAYKRNQGAGPWPKPAKRQRKRLIAN